MYKFIVTEVISAYNLLETVKIILSKKDVLEKDLVGILESAGLETQYLASHFKAGYLVRKKHRPVIKATDKFFYHKPYIELLSKA